MIESYKHLVGKLNSAKKRFHIHEIIKGFLLLILVSILIFYALAITESFFYLSISIKTFLFFGSIIIIAAILFWFVFVPFLRLISILKPIGDKALSKIISSHFVLIKDRLLNLIELEELNKCKNDKLVIASINQKSNELIKYDFNKAISLKSFLRKAYLIIGLLFIIIASNFFLSYSIFNGLERFLSYRTAFERPASFSYHLITDNLKVKRGENLTLKVNCYGQETPEMLYVNISGIDYLMIKSDTYFEYELKHINNSFSFYFTDKITDSERFVVTVLPAPVILDYHVKIIPPPYTNLKNETLNNAGDLELAYGSKVDWNFKTVDVDFLSVKFEEDSVLMEDGKLSHQFLKDENYKISIGNQFFIYDKLLNFKVSVIPDKYPEIEFVQLKDSTDFSRFFFKGSIFDDYGFHQLNFKVSINQIDTVFEIPIIKQLTEQDFYYTFNFKDLVEAGQTAHYYFEVSDNDHFDGFKRTTSESFQFTFPKNEELLDFENQSLKELESLIDKSQELSQEIKESIEELKFKNFSGNSTNWEKQQLTNELVNKKNQLENILEQIEEKNKEMNQFMNSFSDEKKEVLEKQKQIDELLQEVLSDELKELFDEFNKLAQNFKSDEFDKMNDKYDLSLEDLSKKLERNLEVLKRMKVEQKLDRIVDFLVKLADYENSNAKELDNSRDFEKISIKEKENSLSFEQIKGELNQIFELNDELKKPLNFPSFENSAESISNKFKEIIENTTNRRKSRAIKSIEENAKTISDFARTINNTLEQNRNKQNFENINNLRQILDNLVYLSLAQEELLIKLNTISINNPEFNFIVSFQDDLIQQSEIVKDSLYALSNRTPSIGNIVNKELVELEFSMQNSKELLTNERVSSATKSQQESITAINNIAVFLSEVLKNLEKQMSNSMEGDQQCDKPGKQGKDGMNMLKQSQQSLKEQLQQMIEQMKNGNGKGMSKQLGQTLSQQEIMQKLIRDLLNSDEIGSSSKEQLKHIDRLLEQTKIDVINKNISQQTINRQNLILDRLLKAEKAEIERELDDERESKTVEEDFYSNPSDFFEYKKKETKFDDQIYRSKYQLKKFYEEKYLKYLNQVNEVD